MNLLSVQREALRRSDGAPGFAYFMEQGLGKTLTSLADFNERLANREATRLVVECPNSFKNGWKEEVEKHGLNFDTFVWEAGNEKGLEWWMRQEFKKPPMLVVNYESTRAIKTKVGKRVNYNSSTVASAIEKFVEGKGAMFVIDESIQLKQHDSLQSIGTVRLAQHFFYKRILSGKPITQGPHDLWAQMRAIGLFADRNYFAFRGAFCMMGGFAGKQVLKAQNEDILAEMIEPHIFRATKADWTDLPPKTYTIREYTMAPEMKAMYKSMENDFVLWLNSGEVVTIDAAITKYIKLAQIQCGWIYDESGTVRQLVSDEKNPRLNLLKQLIEEEVTGKVAIPYNHKPVYEQLLRTLGGPERCAWIRGGMTPDEISEQKRRFNEDRNVRYILLQTRASRYGHTLLGLPEPGHMCYTMIPYENTYSLDDRSQIEDRIHRHGQVADSVSYVDLVGTPLDRECIKALQRKENVFQSVFSKLNK